MLVTGSAAFETARQLRRRLRRIVPSATPCAVPGCNDGRITHDCCCRHSLTGQGRPENEVPNDGILDWIAIDVAFRRLRNVRLTWVEKDIVFGMTLAQGLGVCEAQARIGASGIHGPADRRLEAAQKIAEALNG